MLRVPLLDLRPKFTGDVCAIRRPKPAYMFDVSQVCWQLPVLFRQAAHIRARKAWVGGFELICDVKYAVDGGAGNCQGPHNQLQRSNGPLTPWLSALHKVSG